MELLNANEIKRLETERNVWLASVRPNGAPHLVPIWFVWVQERVFLCTSKDSVKARNIVQNPRVVFALQDGDDPVVIQATARVLDEIPPAVRAAFREKFDWDIRGDGTYNALIEITPTRVVL